MRLYGPKFWAAIIGIQPGDWPVLDANFTLTVVGTVLSILALVGLIREIMEGIALLRYELDIGPAGRGAEERVGRSYQGTNYTLLELGDQGLITDKAANLRLGDSRNVLAIEKHRFVLPKPIDRYKSNLLPKAPGVKGDTFNDPKIRLASSITAAALETGSPIAVQRSEYYLDRLSNNLGRSVINYRKYPFIEPIQWNIGSNGQFLPFEESPFSNQLGGSCLIITESCQLVYVMQGNGSDENARKLAPSGSGSFDWKDVRSTRTIQELALRGIERELKEETGIDLSKVKFLHRLTGFGRYLYRGGKPEFFSIMIVRTSQLQLIVRPQEWDYINLKLVYRECPSTMFNSKKALCGALEGFKAEIASNKATSGPLYFAVCLAIEYVRSANFKMADLRAFLKESDAPTHR